MILPALYAAIVWVLAMRWRRRWEGYAAVAVGVAGLLAVDAGLGALDRAIPADRSAVLVAGAAAPAGFRSTTFLLHDLLRPYIGVLAVFGFYIASLPRRAPSEAHCRKCHYDLSGLDPRGLACPECGEVCLYRCEACERDFGDASPAGLRCACGARWRGPCGEHRVERGLQHPLVSAANQSDTNAPTSEGFTTPFPS